MSHNYKVLSFNESNGTMVIEFEGRPPLNYWAPRNETSYLSGQELEDAIQALYPEDQVQLENSMLSLEGSEHIKALISPPSTEQIQSLAIAKRNGLLYSCDWTQISDNQLTTEQRNAWAVYRQQLRDITTQPGWPADVTWPTQPTI